MKRTEERMARKTGADMIAAERRRQIEKEGYNASHDNDHCDGELAMAAVCYAAPELIYVMRTGGAYVRFEDPFPPWEDKRLVDGCLPEPCEYSDEKRVDLLVKAGALIAAEIDRLNRQRKVRK